ncbi:hypothetical protein ACE103_09300 [Bradyrhizobium sp. ma5]|uniref:hypothetical protein n=1 Tax=Bradyrhizobium sp. ma5 TaxID=3344828 RepID=UPI0035D50081
MGGLPWGSVIDAMTWVARESRQIRQSVRSRELDGGPLWIFRTSTGGSELPDHGGDLMIQLFEHPSRGSAPRIVFVGRNRRGNWVVREQRGSFGGLFINRAQALKYALFENGRHAESIIEVTREIELDIRTTP